MISSHEKNSFLVLVLVLALKTKTFESMTSFWLILLDFIVIAAFAYAVRWFFNRNENRSNNDRRRASTVMSTASSSANHNRSSRITASTNNNNNSENNIVANQDSMMLNDSPRESIRSAVVRQQLTSNNLFGGFDSSAPIRHKFQVANSNVTFHFFCLLSTFLLN